ncbi:MAG TPA: hypothetical protein VGR06_26760 [Actinophytocola sp.]|jgi:hypothetical protein|uniref:hypothetical protein n=1 Tax=Actinophytocola sp. TaxID=1872138 RepID=UPI002DF9F0B3|nr:hypothetical protein [Actinophytocola sp.]
MNRRHWWITALLVVAATVGAAIMVTRDGSGPRQVDVAARGGRVMPFDLERTTHRFAKTTTGGVQTVVADDPSDTGQIRLVREHLTAENARFRQGDFGDPTTIHGSAMPGLTALTAGYRRITTTYAEQPDGARIAYATDDPALVDALHAWFDAQVSDHGAHAEHETA